MRERERESNSRRSSSSSQAVRHVATSASRQRSQSSGLTADTRRLPCCSRTAWWLLGCTLSLSHSCTHAERERGAHTHSQMHRYRYTAQQPPADAAWPGQPKRLLPPRACLPPRRVATWWQGQHAGGPCDDTYACHTHTVAHAQCVPHEYDFFSTYFLPFCLFDSFTCLVVVQLFRILILPALLDCPLAAL